MMKKQLRSVLAILLCVVLLACCISLPADAAGAPEFLYPANAGDVNGDGSLSLKDARLILRILASLEKKVTDYQRLAADINGDGNLSLSDARDALCILASLKAHPYNETAFKEALQLYTQVMTKAKADKPGYTAIYYLSAPGDRNNRKVIADEELLEILEDLMKDFFEDEGVETTREEAMKDKIVVPKATDMRGFPLFGQTAGALSIDQKLLKAAEVSVSNGNRVIRLVLNDETNPLSLQQGKLNGGSFTGAIFEPISQEEMSDLIPDVEGIETQTTLRHFNCTAILEYNPSTQRIVSLKHEINAAFLINTSFLDVSVGFLQNIYTVYEWFAFVY